MERSISWAGCSNEPGHHERTRRCEIPPTRERRGLAVLPGGFRIRRGPLQFPVRFHRRFYRWKYDAARTLEDLSAKLRDETDLGVPTNGTDSLAAAHPAWWVVARGLQVAREVFVVLFLLTPGKRTGRCDQGDGATFARLPVARTGPR
jgi:hypothetical protein